MKLCDKATYVIVGGAGGLGRSICQLRVERGARHLIILSRSAQSYQHTAFYNELRAARCDVVARSCNIADKADLARALNECSTMPPVKGVIQGGMVLRVCFPQPTGVRTLSYERLGFNFRAHDV